MIRIFRQDSTFSTIPAPLLATAGELTATLGRKFNVNANLRYVLFMREKGTGWFSFSPCSLCDSFVIDVLIWIYRKKNGTKRKTNSTSEEKIGTSWLY